MRKLDEGCLKAVVSAAKDAIEWAAIAGNAVDAGKASVIDVFERGNPFDFSKRMPSLNHS